MPPSTYHAHEAQRRDPLRLSARARCDLALRVEGRRVFDANYRVYGVRKIWRQRQREGFDVARSPSPDMLWVPDFTYVATWAGFVYVAFVIDTVARRIVGWPASRTAHADFVLDALSKPSTIANRRTAAVSSITVIAAANTSQSTIPNASPKSASSPRSAVSATAMTTLWPRRSMAFTSLS
jgi:hypothetical protein